MARLCVARNTHTPACVKLDNRAARGHMCAHIWADIDAHDIVLPAAPNPCAKGKRRALRFCDGPMCVRRHIGKAAAALPGNKTCLTIAIEPKAKWQFYARLPPCDQGRKCVGVVFAKSAFDNDLYRNARNGSPTRPCGPFPFTRATMRNRSTAIKGKTR